MGASLSPRAAKATRVVLRAGLAGFVLLNLLAYHHAHTFTVFALSGTRAPGPEHLSLPQKLGVLWSGATVVKPRNQRTPADIGLAFRTLVYEGHDRIPLEAWYVPQPRSRGLVLSFHGHAGAKASMLGYAARFGRLGYSTLLVDFYGSGGSGGHTTSIGYHEADDVLRSLDYARHIRDEPLVVLHGQSMGAAAVLRAASLRPLPAGALLLECPFDSLTATTRHRFEGMGVPAFPAADLLLFWGGVQQGFNPFVHNPVAYARSVHTPTLLMSGDSDPWVRRDEIQAIYDGLQGPKQLKLFPGVGHENYLRQGAAWTQVVTAFLAQHARIAALEVTR